jgi:hypothetical protein
MDTKPYVEKDGIFIPTPTTPDIIVAIAEELIKAA